jgi:hypothetical protein
MGNSRERKPNVIRRIILLLSVATLMAVMLVAMAMPAFADKGGGGHCTEGGFDGIVVEECAGGSGGPGGGGGGKTQTFSDNEGPAVQQTTGGGSNFRGTGEGGGGRDCFDVFIGEETFSFPCVSGKDAEHPPGPGVE